MANDNLECISLDHDLGDEDEGTGYDVACYIEACAFQGRMKEFRVMFHTQNPVGRAKMKAAIHQAQKAWAP
ncbi:cyclic-phosphate processing receiver domain-containing protein, partial [Acinetobacter baumannii]